MVFGPSGSFDGDESCVVVGEDRDITEEWMGGMVFLDASFQVELHRHLPRAEVQSSFSAGADEVMARRGVGAFG